MHPHPDRAPRPASDRVAVAGARTDTMATVGILANPHNEQAGKLAAAAAEWLISHGHHPRTLAAGELDGIDFALSIGGDGTFLRLVSLAYPERIPIMGVNFGRLGYLLQVQPDDLNKALAAAVSGQSKVEERTALEVRVSGDVVLAESGTEFAFFDGDPTSAAGDPDQRWWLALNEVVAEKTVPGHTVRLATALDRDPFLVYAADGVLVATATGSTAYNLSAGGPVLAPGLRSMVVTPIAPHLGFDRSIVLEGDQEVSITVLETRPAVLVVDGREVGRLAPGGTVTCRAARHPVRFISFGQERFAGRLRTALVDGRDL